MRWLLERWHKRPWWVVKWVAILALIAFVVFALLSS